MITSEFDFDFDFDFDCDFDCDFELCTLRISGSLRSAPLCSAPLRISQIDQNPLQAT
jgi:hypothetical protein